MPKTCQDGARDIKHIFRFQHNQQGFFSKADYHKHVTSRSQ